MAADSCSALSRRGVPIILCSSRCFDIVGGRDSVDAGVHCVRLCREDYCEAILPDEGLSLNVCGPIWTLTSTLMEGALVAIEDVQNRRCTYHV